MNYRLLTSALGQGKANILKYQQQLSSGKAVTKPSDDPGAYAQIRSLGSDLAKLQQYVRNADKALAYHQTVDLGLTQAVEVLHRVNEVAVQGGDGTLDESTRQALADQADELLTSLVAIANGSVGGSHTYAGLRTDTPPYETVLDAEGRITAVQYVGSLETRNIKTGDALYVATNLPGSTTASEGGIFQTATRDVFQTIIDLRDTLAAGGDVAGTPIMDTLQGDLDHLLNNVSLNGARQEQVKAHRTFLLEMQNANQKSAESLESVDLAETTIKLASAETAYEAALNCTSRMLQQPSLLDFL